MKKLKRAGKILLIVTGSLLALVVILMLMIRWVAKADVPAINDMSSLDWKVEQRAGITRVKSNWMRKNDAGLYEMYVEGEPFERGVAIGKLSGELIQKQERIFNAQINKLVPSNFYRYMLKYFVGWYNRDLDDFVPTEYKQEIYGLSMEASHDYDHIASPYQRILNYHAAHDLGHALQNMSLVGCTSFAAWNTYSYDSTLVVARNFDFYVGDHFAEDKLIMFYNPSDGYKFMTISWGGMIGVLSGMNDQGLTVTINAAKSEIPDRAKTPVSLVAREILQYAGTIEEAYAIAKKRDMFVAESFLIASASDRKAAIIEKNTTEMALVYSSEEYIISTNHFQSESLGATQLNQDHIQTSASPYRYERVQALIDNHQKLSPATAVDILRDPYGMENKNIGMGNEKAINQLVAHHGIVFQPDKRLVWISTAPWQLGKFVCYDLNRVFGNSSPAERLYDESRTIASDDFVASKEFKDYLKFYKFRFPFDGRDGLIPDSLVKWNPESYLAYMLAGDTEFDRENFQRALQFYKQGLEKEIATTQERGYILQRIMECEEEL